MAWGNRFEWQPYVPAAQKRAMAIRHAARVAKKQKRTPSPVRIEGRKVAVTFWGRAWCENLEVYSDFANRLPRGMTYVRNGSVVDLVIKPRSIDAIVAGSETYTVRIRIEGLKKAAWQKLRNDCASSIDSLLDLLAGRFSDGVMQRLTRPKDGLFPSPQEIDMECSCPDGSYCCKHLAAVMYGVGNRLDKQPELLFLLRDVDHQELVSQAVATGNLDRELSGKGNQSLAGEDLGALFGIELDSAAVKPAAQSPRRRAAPRPVRPAARAQATKRSAKRVVPAASTRKAKSPSKTSTTRKKTPTAKTRKTS